MGLRARQLLYAWIVLAVGAAAVFNLYALFTPFGQYSCGGDWLCPFNDPVRSLLRWLYIAGAGGADKLHAAYAAGYGPALLALPLLALCLRRARVALRTRSLALPSQFSGLPLWLAAGGAALYLLGDRIWLVVPFPLLDPPHLLGGLCMVLAFVGTEVADLLGSRAAGSPVPQAAPAPGARLRRRPIWGIAAVALAPVLVLLALFAAGRLSDSGGGWGLAPIALVLLAGFGGLALGALATIVAVVRRESWPVLQLAGFLLNFGVGLPLLLKTVH